MNRPPVRRRLYHRTVLAIIILLCPLPSIVFAQDGDAEPSWLLLELGKRAYDDREYGEALFLFRKVIGSGNGASVPGSSEAEMWIGRIFTQEGEYALAEKQYQRALENLELFYAPGNELTTRYLLSELYARQDEYGSYERVLAEIVARDEVFGKSETPAMMENLRKTLLDRGFDKVIELYRLGDPGLVRARLELGEYRYLTGAPEEAVDDLLIGAVTVVSETVAYLRNKDPEYAYSAFPTFVRRAYRWENSREYIAEAELFRIMYYLGASLHAAGYPGPANGVWELVASISDSGVWFDRAIRQLNNPYQEPLLTLP